MSESSSASVSQNEQAKVAQLRGATKPAPHSAFSQWEKTSTVIENVFCYGVTGPVLVFMVSYMIVQIISRTLFTKPFVGILDIIGNSLVVAVFSALAYVQRGNRHIKVDVLASTWSKKRIGTVMQSVVLMVMLLVSIFLVYATTQYGVLPAYRMHWLTESIYLPKWPFYMFAPVGLALLSNRLIIDLIKQIKSLSSER